jgi:hypothetical protein
VTLIAVDTVDTETTVEINVEVKSRVAVLVRVIVVLPHSGTELLGVEADTTGTVGKEFPYDDGGLWIGGAENEGGVL